MEKVEKSVVVSVEELEQHPVRSRLRSLWRRIVIASLTLLILVVIIVSCVYFLYYKEHDQATQLRKAASKYAVIQHAFADPSIILVEGTLYAFATRSIANASLNVQVASAPVLQPGKWTLHSGYDALPNLPAWAGQTGNAAVWAPQPVQRDDGTFVLYYAARMQNHTRKHCIAAATSGSVLGPYQPSDATEPLLCHLNEGGIIDPAFIHDRLATVDNATTTQDLLIYKNDGNGIGSGGACGNGIFPNAPTTFQYSMLNHNRVSFSDAATVASAIWTNTTGNISSLNPAVNPANNMTTFMHNTHVDGPNIESPQIWYASTKLENGSTQEAYHLLYNSGCFADPSYRINYLQCVVDGTKVKQFTDCPWQSLKTAHDANKIPALLETGVFTFTDGQGKSQSAHLYAPGGPGVTSTESGETYMVFHGDLNPVWFGSGLDQYGGEKQHTYTKRSSRSIGRLVARTNAGNNVSLKGRTRGMLIAELGYNSTTGAVYVKEILPPTK